MVPLGDKQAVPLSMFSFKWQFFLVSAPILLSFSSIRMHISAKSCTCCSSRWSVFTSGILMVAHVLRKTDNEESFTKNNIHKVLGRCEKQPNGLFLWHGVNGTHQFCSERVYMLLVPWNFLSQYKSHSNTWQVLEAFLFLRKPLQQLLQDSHAEPFLWPVSGRNSSSKAQAVYQLWLFLTPGILCTRISPLHSL